MEVIVEPLTLSWENEVFQVKFKHKIWESDADFLPCIVLEDGQIVYFNEFSCIEPHLYQSGTFKGFYIDYKDCPKTEICLRTFYLVDLTTKEVMLRLATLKEADDIDEIRWPSPMKTNDGYSVLPFRQGMILPHDERNVLKLPFNGQFCSAAAYLAMLGSVEKDGSLLMINETPWDSRYYVTQLFSQEQTRLGFAHLTSLGKMRYRRDLRYVFF